MSYPYEIDALFNSEMAATASSFVFLTSSNPTPGPTPVPTEPFRVISDTFSVTKDNGTTIEQAHTVLEMSPEDWWLFHDTYGDINKASLIFYRTWTGSVNLYNEEAYTHFIAEMAEGTEDPEYTLCSVTVPLLDDSGDSSGKSTGIQVTIKTYIGDTEITDPTYKPYIQEYYEEHDATLEKGELPEDNWLWKTGIFPTGESDDPVYYKLCIQSAESSEEQALNDVAEWSIIGSYSDVGGDTYTLTIKSDDEVFVCTCIQINGGYPSRHRIPIMKGSTQVGEIKINSYNEDGTEYIYPYNNPFESVFPLTATKI